MKYLRMGKEILQDIYKVNNFKSKQLEPSFNLDKITERDKFHAAKQILLGLAILYVMTVIAYLMKPIEGSKLLDVCIITIPQLATIILVAYFRDKASN